MRIDSSSRIGGAPILEVRKLLQHVREQDFSTGYAVELLDLTPAAASVLMAQLLNQGLVDERPTPPWSETDDTFKWYRTTIQGNALSIALAAKPILRETADRLLARFMERVGEVNRNPKFVYKATLVRVFGSYLTSVPTLGDIDLDITVESKFPSGDARHDAMQARIHDAVEHGRAFRNIVDYYSWPLTEVLLYLKNMSRALSLHVKDPIVNQSEYQVLYSGKRHAKRQPFTLSFGHESSRILSLPPER